MAKRFNIGEVLKNHTHYKSALTKVYKSLQIQNETNLELMRLIKPLIEKSDIERI